MCNLDDYSTFFFGFHQKKSHTKTHGCFSKMFVCSPHESSPCFRKHGFAKKKPPVLQQNLSHSPPFCPLLSSKTRGDEDSQELERYRQLCGPMEVWSMKLQGLDSWDFVYWTLLIWYRIQPFMDRYTHHIQGSYE